MRTHSATGAASDHSAALQPRTGLCLTASFKNHRFHSVGEQNLTFRSIQFFKHLNFGFPCILTLPPPKYLFICLFLCLFIVVNSGGKLRILFSSTAECPPSKAAVVRKGLQIRKPGSLHLYAHAGTEHPVGHTTSQLGDGTLKDHQLPKSSYR